MATAFKQIATYTATNDSIATITFSSIPNIYKHLMVIASVGSVSDGREFQLHINDDTGASSYSWTRMVGDPTPASSNVTATSYGRLGDILSDDSQRSIIHIPLYKDTNFRKQLIMEQVTSSRVTWFCTHWHSTNAITKLKFFVENASTFRNHSTISLYGIEG